MTLASKEAKAPTDRPRVLIPAVLGAVLLWLAQPPAGLWPLAYAGVAVWLWLASSPLTFDRREYLRVWLGGVLYWLITLHWVRLPCWPLTALGLPPLAMYLALYTLAIVALVRMAKRRWHAPLWIAAPVAWVGMELVQARMLTGFLMGAVSHTHAGQPWVRSIAAFTGAYGVSFAIALVAATLASFARDWRPAERGRAGIGLVSALTAVVVAGWLARTGIEIDTPSGPRPRVALIQGDTRATWDPDPNRNNTIMERQVALSVEAASRASRAGLPLDLVVWPESMFRSPVFSFDGALARPDEARAASTARYDEVVQQTSDWFVRLTGSLDATPLLVGIDRYDVPTDPDAGPSAGGQYNSAALIDGAGRLVSVYDKTHLVPFGEYIPLARGLPALYFLTPMEGGMSAGDGPVAMRTPVADGRELVVCPSICYETVVPHLPRRHVAELTKRGERPDVLINVTNNAWFWGSSELDMHLACGVYRAIETGTPLLIAANGGLSAVIDATGAVVEVGPRMAEHVLIGEVPPRSAEPTPYVVWGDLFAGVCLALSVVFGVADVVQRVRLRRLRRM